MRKITTLTLAITGLIELVTSIVLYIIPSGRVAYLSNYQLFGLSKTEWGNIHITVGTLFVITGSLHIYYTSTLGYSLYEIIPAIPVVLRKLHQSIAVVSCA